MGFKYFPKSMALIGQHHWVPSVIVGMIYASILHYRLIVLYFITHALFWFYILVNLIVLTNLSLLARSHKSFVRNIHY